MTIQQFCRLFGTLALTLASCLPTAHAASDDEIVCKRDGNQQEMNTCAVGDYKKADDALNATYKAVMAALSADKQTALRTEQRTWLKKRDAQCNKEADEYKGGSMAPLIKFGCLANSTDKRTKVLERWAAKKA